VFLARVQLVTLDQRILLVPTRTPVYDLSSGKTALMVGANRSTSKPVAVGRLGNLIVRRLLFSVMEAVVAVSVQVPAKVAHAFSFSIEE
jgi:hypothetical protein